MTDQGTRFRLPTTVTPDRYDLEVVPDLGARTFRGTIAAGVTVHRAVREIVMNAAELEITEPRVTRADGTVVAITGIRLDAETERVHVDLAEELPAGTATVTLSFAGPLNERLVGFYASTYRDEGGTEHVIGTTHFESTDARRAFPCWDEPEHKAVWGVSLVVDDGLLAISNAAEIGREAAGPGKVRVRFADSMKMSSYLVAYVVGRLEATSPRDVDGVPLRIVHVPGKGDLTSFGLDAGAAALRFFSSYYGIPYPGDKLDMVALPDFAMGAMENLGCITYREALLIVDPDRAAQREVQIVAEVIAHEIAHMWFGDLVTMRWWNGIWLNEAFASLMETLSVDDWKPEWDLWTQFGAYRALAFEVDALESTRPIEYPVESPDDSQDMFDVLTYTKGQAVLRMLERYLGDGFREGIRRYLARHAYGNTETEDLWAALEEASGEPVRRIMDPWILRGGYPVVSATAAGGAVRLQPTRFLLGEGDTGSPWEVPLTVRHAGGEARVLVPPTGIEVAVDDGPVVVNAGAHAFARVRYDDDLLARLTGSLRRLSASERFQLVDDTWASVLAGSTPATTFVRFAQAFDGEDDLTVWQALLKGFEWLDRCVEGAPREALAVILRRLARPAFDRLGLEPMTGEAPTARALRGSLFRALGVLAGDPEIAAMAREEESRSRSGEQVDADVASAAVDVVAANGDVADLERFLAARAAASTPQEELRYLYAIADFRDPEAFRRALAIADSDQVRIQEQPFVLRDAIANRDHGPQAWTYVRDRWESIASRVSPANLERIADGVRFLLTPELQAETSAFFAAHDIPQAHQQLMQSLERQRINVRLREAAARDLASMQPPA